MAFIIQKLHQSLQLGQRLTIAGSSTPAFVWQSASDSACAGFSAVMALALLGYIRDPAKVSCRSRGPEAKLWHRLHSYHFSGMTLDELAAIVSELNWGLRPVLIEGKHRDVIAASTRELLAGHLVIVNWRPLRTAHHHAVLCIGIEGRQTGRSFEPHALLALDPGENEPWLAPCNARLVYAGTATSKQTATYVTAGYEHRVIVNSALAIRSMRKRRT